MDSIDYRRIPRALSQVYYQPLNDENRREMDKLFQAFTSRSNVLYNYKLTIWGQRVLSIPECTINPSSYSEGTGISPSPDTGSDDPQINTAKMTFKELCGEPLSAADYIELTRTFGIIIVLNIPKMGLSEKDFVRVC
jgi:peroxisome-assembly ATPase